MTIEKTAAIAKVRAQLQAQYDRIIGVAEEALKLCHRPGQQGGVQDTTPAAWKPPTSPSARPNKPMNWRLRWTISISSTGRTLRRMTRSPSGLWWNWISMGTRVFFLIAPRGGGVTCDLDGVELSVLTPMAPLFDRIAGRRAGEMLSGPPLRVISVR